MKPVLLKGRVKRFRGNGRKLGYPTANLIEPTTLGDGVYFGTADLEAYTTHPALIFIGIPTTMGDKDRRIEVHLLDIIDKDYYDQELKASVLHFHRANQKLQSIKELIKIMQADEAASRVWFRRHDLLS